MKHPTEPVRPQGADTEATSTPKTLPEAERRVLERGDVQLKPQHPGSADDPESQLHIDSDEEDERDDALHADEDELPVFGSHSNH
jgi:hypothetical protein